MTAVKRNAIEFFMKHAGSSYDPATETPKQGKFRGAKRLAEAEAWLVAQPGFTVEWEIDRDYDPSDYDIDMPDTGWGCIVNANGNSASLWATTFDGDGEPFGNAYARVVVAELALELMPD